MGWSHFIEIIPLDDPLKREFYAEMCWLERWSVRILRARIDGMLYERTAIAKKPEELVRRELEALRAEDRLTPDLVFHDPYVLDFLQLHGAYSEQDLEQAILRELESSCWSWAATSPSSPARSASRWIAKTTISTSYSSTGACAASWPSS